jgi:hypothetical protein
LETGPRQARVVVPYEPVWWRLMVLHRRDLAFCEYCEERGVQLWVSLRSRFPPF